MRIIQDVKLDFKDVLIVPKRSTLNSRQDVDLNREFKFKHSTSTWKGIPIMSANMDTVSTFEMSEVLSSFNMLTFIHKFYSLDDWKKQINSVENLENIVYVLGTSNSDYERFLEVYKYAKKRKPLKWVCLDVANGYTEYFLKVVEKLRKYEELILVAGNVATPEMTEALILAGVDVVKLGIGPGSACTTRLKSGVGYPQLSAVMECADAAHGLGGHVISDGGCTVPGDIAKAFGGGADFVMLGGMLAGHKEAGEQNLIYNGKKIVGVRYYGMSSDVAMSKYYGEKAEYRSAEGKEMSIPYKGPVKGTLEDILGGIRSACTYTGSRAIKELSKRTTFVRVTQQHNPLYDNYVTKS